MSDADRIAALEAELATAKAGWHAAEERLKRLIDPMPDAIFYVNRDRKFVDGNPFFRAAYKSVYNVEPSAGVDALSGVPEPLATLWNVQYDIAFSGTETSFLFRETIAGSLATFDVRLVPNVINGVIDGVTCVSRNVTVLYNLKQDLEQTKQEITAVLESSSDAIWSVDASLRIRTMNARFVDETFEAVGVRPRIGMGISEVLGDKFSKVSPFYERALNGETFGFEFTYPIVREAGPPEIRHLEVQMLPLRDATRAVIGVTVFNKDVTQKRMLLAQVMELDRLVAIGTLAAGVGHEVNNPLAFVLTNIELIRENLERFRQIPPTREDIDEGLSMIADAEDGARRIRDIVRDLRLLSRADDSRSSLPIDVRAPLERALALAGHELRLRAEVVREFLPLHIPASERALLAPTNEFSGAETQDTASAEAEGANRVDPMVRGADGRLTQVFLNLLVNAAHAFPLGHRGTVRVSVRRDGNRVLVRVSDDGVGIPEEILPRIFDAFFTTKPRGEGTGLGLSIARRILLEHGGDLTILSTPGAGTTAIVMLPVI